MNIRITGNSKVTHRNIDMIAKNVGNYSYALQLQKNPNYSFHQVEKLLLNAAKADVFDSEIELANFYKKHKMFKEALY